MAEVPDWLTRNGGESINWQNLTALVSGILATSYFESLADLISALFNTILITPLRILGAFVGDATGALVTPETACGGLIGTCQAQSFARSFGTLGFLIAVGIVLVIAYVAARGGGALWG